MTIKRYNTAKEYLDDDTITNASQIAWHTLESEELSNGISESFIIRSHLIQISILVMVFKCDIPIKT